MLKSFDVFDKRYRDENNCVKYYDVSVHIIDFHGERTYSNSVNVREIRILIDTEEKIQIEVDRKKIIYRKRKTMDIANDFREISGFNGFGIGFALSCHEDEIDQATDLCTTKLWKQIKSRKGIPDWVHEFADKEPKVYKSK
ncbi:hypothetical protein BC351_00555 [Paenibacillus ferrarius]|uniref:Uncharacterized protein n=1 Tax=Paenibacillus ferrarius TaxID=1469647 RepID=A0A1V4HSB8_9BACL|nr:hypothetical protein [Paenibacillus ferrarius]OPH61766.1 hypothetical protein BC351_00555 [Paenibacillus ferrarius]